MRPSLLAAVAFRWSGKGRRGSRERKEKKIYSCSKSPSKIESLRSLPTVWGDIFLTDLFLAVRSTSCTIVLLMACTVAREKPIVSVLSAGSLIPLCTVTKGLSAEIFIFFFFLQAAQCLKHLGICGPHLKWTRLLQHTKYNNHDKN